MADPTRAAPSPDNAPGCQPRARNIPTVVPTVPPYNWTCLLCTVENTESDHLCMMCGAYGRSDDLPWHGHLLLGSCAGQCHRRRAHKPTKSPTAPPSDRVYALGPRACKCLHLIFLCVQTFAPTCTTYIDTCMVGQTLMGVTEGCPSTHHMGR